MKIGKSQFIEYLRCDRYAALDDVRINKNDSFVTNEDIDYKSEKYYDMVESLSIAIDDIKIDNSSIEVMMPYFNKIEVMAGKRVENLSNIDVVTSMSTFEQQKLECEFKDAILYSYVDVFAKKDKDIVLCEVKGVTSNTLWKVGKTLNAQDKENLVSKDYKSIFRKCSDGICRLRHEVEGFSFEDSVLSEKEYLKKRGQLYDYTTDIGRIVLDLSFQRFVLERMYGKLNSKFYLGVLNGEYIFDGTYEDGEPVYNKDENGEEIIMLVDLTQTTYDMQDKLEVLLCQVIDRLEKGDASQVNIGKHCMRKKTRQCRYFDICWDFIPKKYSIFTYLGNHHGFKDENNEKYDVFELANNNITKMLDVPDNYLNRRNNYVQKKCLKDNQEYINSRLISSGINALQYPLYHLDFESFPVPLPRFKGEMCYSQSVFQFSIHIEKSPGVCDKNKDHYEFLAKDHKDRREELVKEMIDIIKDDDGSIIVYNQSFEKTRINEFANFFGKYKDRLDNINGRIFDLMYLLKGNKSFYESRGFDMSDEIFLYYHKDLEGSFSIKKVLPLFSDLSYSGMEVANGGEAMLTYGMYHNFTKQELETKTAGLIEYCKQDTWAMVVILDKLRDMCK